MNHPEKEVAAMMNSNENTSNIHATAKPPPSVGFAAPSSSVNFSSPLSTIHETSRSDAKSEMTEKLPSTMTSDGGEMPVAVDNATSSQAVQFERGIQLASSFSHSHLKEARLVLSELLEKDPSYRRAESLHHLALIALRLNDYRAARHYADQLVLKMPRSALARSVHALVLDKTAQDVFASVQTWFFLFAGVTFITYKTPILRSAFSSIMTTIVASLSSFSRKRTLLGASSKGMRDDVIEYAALQRLDPALIAAARLPVVNGDGAPGKTVAEDLISKLVLPEQKNVALTQASTKALRLDAYVDPVQKQQKLEKRDITRRHVRFSKKEMKKQGMLDYADDKITFELALKLHQLWVQYQSQILPPLRCGEGSTEFLLARCNVAAVSDFHGAYILVAQSLNPSYIGICGIIVRETEKTFVIVSEDNRLRTVLKNVCVFHILTHDAEAIASRGASALQRQRVYVMHGMHACYRTALRSKLKMKLKPAIGL